MDASGKEDVFVETVGVGQAEIDIIDHADTIVLALMPGSGDSVQALKAGVMEIPDVIVVNKANHPLTDSMVREIRGVLALGPVTDWKVPILKTEATEGRGVDEVAQAIDAHHAHIEAGHARGAARAQPAQRGAGARRRAPAARAGALAARRPERPGAARPRRAPRGRPGERGGGAAQAPARRRLSRQPSSCRFTSSRARAPATSFGRPAARFIPDQVVDGGDQHSPGGRSASGPPRSRARRSSRCRRATRSRRGPRGRSRT